VEEGIAAYEAWRARRVERLETGSEPSRRVVTVKHRAAEDAGAHIPREPSLRPVEWVEVPRPDGETRPGGDRFGALVHAALAIVPFTAVEGSEGPDGVEVIARARTAVTAYSRALGATPAEVDSATTLVARALSHPLVARAASAAEVAGASEHHAVRREVPVFMLEPDGTLVEGVADLSFRETGTGAPRWIVVDYKTDRSIERSRLAYEAQVARYAAAIEAATGVPAYGVVLAL